jgi:hypothetical protein
MLKKSLHVHLVHNVKAVLFLGHVEDRLRHKLVQHKDVVLLFKEEAETSHKIVLKQLALGNE